jgi:hypothetical protein
MNKDIRVEFVAEKKSMDSFLCQNEKVKLSMLVITLQVSFEMMMWKNKKKKPTTAVVAVAKVKEKTTKKMSYA